MLPQRNGPSEWERLEGEVLVRGDRPLEFILWVWLFLQSWDVRSNLNIQQATTLL